MKAHVSAVWVMVIHIFQDRAGHCFLICVFRALILWNALDSLPGITFQKYLLHCSARRVILPLIHMKRSWKILKLKKKNLTLFNQTSFNTQHYLAVKNGRYGCLQPGFEPYVLPLTSCMSVGKLISLAQFLCLWNGNNNNLSSSWCFSWKRNELKSTDCWEQGPEYRKHWINISYYNLQAYYLMINYPFSMTLTYILSNLCPMGQGNRIGKIICSTKKSSRGIRVSVSMSTPSCFLFIKIRSLD